MTITTSDPSAEREKSSGISTSLEDTSLEDWNNSSPKTPKTSGIITEKMNTFIILIVI